MMLAQIPSPLNAIEKIENLIPAKYRTLLMLAAIVVPYAGRAYHALASGGGLMGVYRALLFGTNVPKAEVRPPISISTNDQTTTETHNEPKT
jgi:hypothetical protein